jgi:serine O-acetyltransferase
LARPLENLATCDPVWSEIRANAQALAENEPRLAGFLHAAVLKHRRLEDALAFHLAEKLANGEMGALELGEVIAEAFETSPAAREAIRADVAAANDRDPACRNYLTPFLYYKGFLALQAYRVAHELWSAGRVGLAGYLQNRTSEVFGVDIHPAARIGKGIFVDHATGLVIGETAVVEDDVSMLHGVTLGGTGKAGGDRHPKIRRGVLLGAGAKVLGNIEVGECARVASGSVVLKSVPPHCTAAGVPARLMNCQEVSEPARAMDHMIKENGVE